MSLHDQIAADIDMFLSLDDFAVTREFNGHEVAVIIDDERLSQAQVKDDRLYSADVMIYIRASDADNDLPAVGSFVNFDGQRNLKVEYAVNEEGIFIIAMSGFRR